MNGQRGMETERECERRRGGQSQTRRQQTKAAREKEGKDVQWRKRDRGRSGKGGGGLEDEEMSMELVTVCNKKTGESRQRILSEPKFHHAKQLTMLRLKGQNNTSSCDVEKTLKIIQHMRL